MSYGDTEQVQALVRHLPFDDAAQVNPRTTDVQIWLDQATTQIDGLLLAGGYAVPIANTRAVEVLGGYANAFAAGMAERSMQPQQSSQKDDTERGDRWFRYWNGVAAWIAGPSLEGLGVHATTPARPDTRPVSSAASVALTW